MCEGELAGLCLVLMLFLCFFRFRFLDSCSCWVGVGRVGGRTTLGGDAKRLLFSLGKQVWGEVGAGLVIVCSGPVRCSGMHVCGAAGNSGGVVFLLGFFCGSV